MPRVGPGKKAVALDETVHERLLKFQGSKQEREGQRVTISDAVGALLERAGY